MSHGMSATLLPSQGDKGLGLGTSHMYIKTESGEIIEFHDRHHPERGKISSDNYSELYEKLYGSVGVKPVDGVLSWQLFAIRMNRDGEMCIATFETVKQANLALKSFCSARRFLSGWDAVEYKNGLSDDQSTYYNHLDDDVIITKMYIRTESGQTLQIYGVYRHIHEIEESRRERYSDYYGRPYIKPVDGASSWQLLLARLDDDSEEICIATFDTLKDASDALDSLEKIYSESGGWDAIEYKEPKINKPKRRGTQTLAKFLAKPVMEFELSVRASNCLETANIKTIREIVTKEEKDMLEYKNFGRASLNEIKEQLANMGLSLGMNLDDMDWDPDIAEEYTGPDVLSH